MGENSNIEWTHHTFNLWIGCTKVSPGCDNCYAEVAAARFNMAEWGAGKPRRLASDDYWKQPLAWNRKAEKSGQRARVFCASMADVFDNEVPEEWRVRLWKMIYDTPHLDWLLLTKRIGNAADRLPLGAYRDGPLPNLWLGITVVNQQEAERDIPKLLALPARVRFLSMEPLLGPVDLEVAWHGESALANECLGDCGWCKKGYPPLYNCQNNFNEADFDKGRSGIDWVIVGGESGLKARPMHPDWARSLRDQCEVAGVPFFFKQWGEWCPISHVINHNSPQRILAFDGGINQPLCGWGRWAGNRNWEQINRVGKKIAGRLLDNREWNEFPGMAAWRRTAIR